ncbi:endonuclease/exonuclease/phosphatase family protein [Antarcticibacterium flavum]|uniref:Endonuclease/exonuclease/phosphatase family protein n=2 Tax=Flavobacteriaceae TaxID=49546 RepID=A0A5B7X8G1_9FLAO|nr:endonuclease [Antarcticibacterium sp. W02-3]QCY71415.1 endonuclease/exonuclease/phosphatase family protein [Antarcticibacterium flavum]
MSILFPGTFYAQDDKLFLIRTIAFYNVENLFDTIDDPWIFDEDRTPKGKDIWTVEKYQDKLTKISRVIADIGQATTNTTPAIIGVCEIENLTVLEDLVNRPLLLDSKYGIIHFDSPDSRGIDVGLLYKKDVFIPGSSSSHRLLLYDRDEPAKRVYTRDQLVVSGYLDGEPVHFIVNHWPSRSGGEARSSYKREQAAKLNRRIIDSLSRLEVNPKIIVMGDFNDDPHNKSIKKVLGTTGDKSKATDALLYNPMEQMLKRGQGTLAYRDGWNLFDQIIISRAFLSGDYSSYQFYKAGIFNPDYLITPHGQFKGYPYRSYDYGGYTGGYSDHFPVYLFLIRELP